MPWSLHSLLKRLHVYIRSASTLTVVKKKNRRGNGNDSGNDAGNDVVTIMTSYVYVWLQGYTRNVTGRKYDGLIIRIVRSREVKTSAWWWRSAAEKHFWPNFQCLVRDISRPNVLIRFFITSPIQTDSSPLHAYIPHLYYCVVSHLCFNLCIPRLSFTAVCFSSFSLFPTPAVSGIVSAFTGKKKQNPKLRYSFPVMQAEWNMRFTVQRVE